MWRYADIRTVPDIVRYWAERTPAATALRYDGRRVSYSELDERSNRVARALLRSGASLGSHVGFLGKNSPEFFELWFGATKAGAAVAPFNWRCTVDELCQLVNDAQPRVIVVADEFAETVRRVRDVAQTPFEIVSFDPSRVGRDQFADWVGGEDGGEVTDPGVGLAGAETALLAYTSGTTGRPKGVQISHTAFQYSFLCLALEPALCWDSGDLLLMVMPNFHLAGSWVSLPALYHGGSITILPFFEPAAMLAALEHERPTVTCLVPAAIQMVLDHPDCAGTDFSSLRSMIYAGSPISTDILASALQVFGCEMNQFYGATEAWIISLLRPAQHDLSAPHSLTSCGTPMPFVDIQVLDPDGGEVADGAIGEFHVRSPAMFSGYYNQPDATAAALHNGWYRTGDLGTRDATGLYFVLDRAKDLIITGGENVYSIEVERTLARHDGVASVAVVGLPDPKWGERVTAFVTLHPDATVNEAQLRAHCKELIAGYKVPKTIHIEPELPTTPSGKIQKAALRTRLAPQ